MCAFQDAGGFVMSHMGPQVSMPPVSGPLFTHVPAGTGQYVEGQELGISHWQPTQEHLGPGRTLGKVQWGDYLASDFDLPHSCVT